MPATGPDPLGTATRPAVCGRTATSPAYVVRQATSADLPGLTTPGRSGAPRGAAPPVYQAFGFRPAGDLVRLDL